MLVLARKIHQKIVIGDNIVVQVLRKTRDVVKLGIDAPISVPVHRQEVYEQIQRSNKAALHRGTSTAPKYSKNLQATPSSPVQEVTAGATTH